jgi:leader peptidase (prepilin peptidase)/N-methyltransferase
MNLADLSVVAAAFPWFFPLLAFIFGTAIGSFLNVVIYRVPAGRSIVTPGSTCACGQPIAWYDNIPVLSWFILRGRARCCGRAYSFRYPFIELLTGLLFLACWLHFTPAKAACGAIFLSALLCATFIDLDHMVIPDVFTIWLGVFGVILSFAIPELHGQHRDVFLINSLRSGMLSIEGMLIGSGLVLWIALIAEAVLKKEAMGFGDVKFVGAIGAFAGWHGAVFSVFGGAVVGTIWIACAVVWQKLSGKTSPVAPRAETPEGAPSAIAMGVHIPFGPMLAVAGALYFLVFEPWVTQWFKTFSELF